MGFPPMIRKGMLNFEMGQYKIRFVAADNRKALLGISDWALGGDHRRD
jgi:hypothetical protein